MSYPRFTIGAKNVLLILIAILIVTGAFVFAEYRNNQSKELIYKAVVSAPKEAISSDLQTKDSDNDGLKDWEEVLLGTNPHNPDTDGDGTNDGKEVSLNRNPLIKGPNDSAKVVATSATKEQDLTPTDRVARDFFARYMELNQMGLSGDTQSQKDLIGQVLKNGVLLATPKTYSLQNIITIPDTSKEAIRKYGNEVGALFKKNPNNGRDEAVIAKDSIEKDDPDILKEIDPIIKIYTNIVTGLLKIKTPSNIASLHLATVNAMSKFLFVATSLRESSADALKGLQGTSAYLDAGKSLIGALQAIKGQLEVYGITYTPSEPGSMFQN